MPVARVPETLYHGRFAPTPSGPLHFGSVVAAVGSYLQARRYGGRWSLRFEDLDTARVQAGAADSILRDLERLGLHWDGEPVYQSRRREDHEVALAQLVRQGATFPCGCTRRETRGVYPGTCRNGLPPGRRPRALRLRMPALTVDFADRLQGGCRVDLQREIGDIVLRRADNVIAYHLAVVVDDAATGVTEVVRGTDLLAATAPQIALQRLLGLPTPGYLHLPLVLDAAGRKISKQNHAPPVHRQPPERVIADALQFLGQQPDPAIDGAPVSELLAWARDHWRVADIPRHDRQVPGPRAGALTTCGFTLRS